ncbi:MAG: acyltransferase family protein [Lachnospiraceae bacterium]|nr:acyltransferase family protein [Lachnospiraceae bacterium]
MMDKKKRVSYFDTARGIGMILVLLGHLQNDTVFSYSPHILGLCAWIFSFHMPLFFIISGMLICFKEEEKGDIGTIVKKRFRQIMIPYFWFSFIYIFIVLYYLIIARVILLKTLLIQLWYVLGMYGMNVLWFLPALFAAEIMFVLITQRFKNQKSIIAVLVLLIGAIIINYARKFLPNDSELFERINEFIVTLIRPVFACSFILIGYLLFKGIKVLNEKTKRAWLVMLLSLPLLLFVNILINIKNRPVDFRSLVFNNYPLYYICSTCGSLFIIILCMLLSKIRIGNKINGDNAFPVLKFYGVNSLVFMAVHNNSSIMTLALKLAMYLNQYLTRARGYICYALVILIFLIYITLTIMVINRFFPFLAGKPYKPLRSDGK